LEQNKKIKVLRIINRFNIGGPTYNAAYLTKYLDDRFETMLVGGAKDESEASSEFILDSLDLKPTLIQNMRRSIGLSDISAYRQISQIIKEFKPDIVHTHASKSGFLGRLAAYRNNVPVILHTFHGHVFHSYFGDFKTNFYKSLERWLAKRSTRIIAISKQQKIEIGTEHLICPPDKIEVIPLGFDLERFYTGTVEKRKDFRERYDLKPDDIAIVIVGRLVPIKNHELFIEAIRALSDRGYDNLRFFIVGDGESRENLEQKLNELNIGFTKNSAPSTKNPVCFTSWVKDVDRVYAGCEIVCLTSLNEGTPVSLIEAQSASKPVLSTKVGGINDIVLENESALLCGTKDTLAFVQHLDRLINDQDLRLKMGDAGKENALKKFHYQRLVSDIAQLYSELMKKVS